MRTAHRTPADVNPSPAEPGARNNAPLPPDCRPPTCPWVAIAAAGAWSRSSRQFAGELPSSCRGPDVPRPGGRRRVGRRPRHGGGCGCVAVVVTGAARHSGARQRGQRDAARARARARRARPPAPRRHHGSRTAGLERTGDGDGRGPCVRTHTPARGRASGTASRGRASCRVRGDSRALPLRGAATHRSRAIAGGEPSRRRHRSFRSRSGPGCGAAAGRSRGAGHARLRIAARRSVHVDRVPDTGRARIAGRHVHDAGVERRPHRACVRRRRAPRRGIVAVAYPWRSAACLRGRRGAPGARSGGHPGRSGVGLSSRRIPRRGG